MTQAQQAEEAKAKAAALAKCYARVFRSEDGQKVLADLTNRYIMRNDVNPNAQNVNYEAAYKNGEAGVVKAIINQMQRAEIL